MRSARGDGHLEPLGAAEQGGVRGAAAARQDRHRQPRPGQQLGTEADLLQQFDVSRPTLRESLRILEAQGVVELRPGPRGGILVSKPGMDMLAHGLSVYLRLHDVPFIAVLQAREVIEPALAAAVAANATEEDSPSCRLRSTG